MYLEESFGLKGNVAVVTGGKAYFTATNVTKKGSVLPQTILKYKGGPSK